MRKIGIIGSSPSRVEAPYGDSDWEFWSLNNLFTHFVTDSFTRWFELHDIKIKNNWYYRRDKDYYGDLTVLGYLLGLDNLGIPVYMQRKWPIVSKSEPFPFQEIIKQFNSTYFGCSFAWMIAFALYKHLQGDKIDTIGFWGVELEGAEYYKQRPSTEYWIGRTQGMGIEIIMPKDCQLLNIDKMYAIEEDYDWIENNYVKLKDHLNKIALYLQQEVI